MSLRVDRDAALWQVTLALRYMLKVRDIKCEHAHNGPDEFCARCIADGALSLPGVPETIAPPWLP